MFPFYLICFFCCRLIDITLQSLSNQLKDGGSLKVLQITGDIRVVQIIVGKVLNAFTVMRFFYLEKVLVSLLIRGRS